MPRKRRVKSRLPSRNYIKTPLDALLNPKVDNAAYRLLNLIIAYSWETGHCNLNNSDFARLLGCSREYARRLLGELSAIGLVQESTLNGRRILVPVCAIDLMENIPDGRQLLESEDGTFEQQAPPESGRASSSSRTPRGNAQPKADVNYSCADVSTIVDKMPLEEDESINELPDIKVSSSSSSIREEPSTQVDKNVPIGEKPATLVDKTGKGNKTSTIVDKTSHNEATIVDRSADLDFARIAAAYTRYCGELDNTISDLLGDYLDDSVLAQIAAVHGENPVDWILSAIQEAGLNKAQKPANYFRAILRDWISRGNRQPLQKVSTNGTHKETETPLNPVITPIGAALLAKARPRPTKG